MIYEISAQIRETGLVHFEEVFHEAILKEINERRSTQPDDLLEYRIFKTLSRQDFNKRFLRYYLARIEKYIADGISTQMPEKFYNLVRNTGRANGYHIEHILGKNRENLRVFGNDEEFFEQQRNRLSGLLLLKGRDNQSSNNEIYNKKLETYAGTLLWNESLREDFYKSKLDTRDFIDEKNLNMKPYTVFDDNALEERSQLMYDITKDIWNLNDE